MIGPSTASSAQHLEGFEVPVHGSLGSPILLGGAPRGLAIVNGTLAAAVGLGLQQWIAGLVLWALGHSIAVVAARRDPDFASVMIRHLRQKGYFAC
ncbi:VirB3 family type IV secretion system protein [Novosphingobium sp. 1748]|nr:VirB3 family type IV secretion system protein [Novosphingobium sp. 1748]MDR6709389.1 type IV secretion system protein VirB3 [Novosphingobium sp. 1748]